MSTAMHEQIRNLAQPLWESAARPYGMAIDFWLMAEQMVLEVMASTARIQDRAVNPPPLPPQAEEIPAAAPVRQVREMAEIMWEAAGRQYGVAQDFWLSAERHVLAMVRAAAQSASTSDPRAAEWATLSPGAYLDRIRVMAYFYWEAAGRSYGQTLDCWLKAERDVLNMMAAAAGRTASGMGTGTDLPVPPGAAGAVSQPSATASTEGTAAVEPVAVTTPDSHVVTAPAETTPAAETTGTVPADSTEVGDERGEAVPGPVAESVARASAPRKKAATPKADAVKKPRAKGTQSPAAS